MPKYIFDADNAVLIQMEPGKPDSKDHSKRVTQKAQPDKLSCHFYALNRIRERIGKNSQADQYEKRRNEQKISTLRKVLPKVEVDFASKKTKSLSKQDLLLLFLSQQTFQLDDEYYNMLNQLYINFLAEFEQTDLQSLYGDYRKKLAQYMPDEIPWEKLTPQQKYTCLKYFSQQLERQLFGIEESNWHPNDGLDVLISQLKQNGPMMAEGYFS